MSPERPTWRDRYPEDVATCIRCLEVKDLMEMDRLLWCEECRHRARERAAWWGWLMGLVFAGFVAAYVFLVVRPSDLVIGGWIATIAFMFPPHPGCIRTVAANGGLQEQMATLAELERVTRTFNAYVPLNRAMGMQLTDVGEGRGTMHLPWDDRFTGDAVTNDLGETIKTTWTPGARREHPIVCVFGEPFDYSEFTTSRPRASLYKKCADRLLETIGALSSREKELRSHCAAGDISPRDPRWLTPAR